MATTTYTPIPTPTAGSWVRIHTSDGSTAVTSVMVSPDRYEDRVTVEIVWTGDPEHVWEYRLHDSDWDKIIASSFPIMSLGRLANMVKHEAVRSTKLSIWEGAWEAYAEATVG